MKPMKLKPRNYVAAAKQSGAGKHTTKKQQEERKLRAHEAEAMRENELHATFFGMPNVPVREIRNKIDPILRAHEIREITKVYLGEDDNEL